MCSMAAELELPEVPVLLVPPEASPVLASSLLEVQVNLPWMLPFPPWDSGAKLLRAVHSSVMSAVEVSVKVPTTSLMEGMETLSAKSAFAGIVDMNGTRYNSRSEVSANGDGTAHICEQGNSQVLESSVVDDSETTTNGSQGGQVQLGHVGVVEKRQVAGLNLGQVRERQGGEVVGVKTERAVDGLEGRNRKGGDVGDGQVGSPDQVVHGDGELLAIGLEEHAVADGLQGQFQGLETAVVIQVHEADRSEGVTETSQGAEVGVANGDRGSGGDTAGEGQLTQSGQSGPGDGTNTLKLGHAQGGEGRQVIESEGVGDGGQGASGQGD